jgi:hypothetical protein
MEILKKDLEEKAALEDPDEYNPTFRPNLCKKSNQMVQHKRSTSSVAFVEKQYSWHQVK